MGFMPGKKTVETPYRREIISMPPDVVELHNKLGRLRAHSFGDYRPEVDYDVWRMALLDAEAKGLYLKAITKIPEFIRAFGGHPNLRANISIDDLPREMSNEPSMKKALALKKIDPDKIRIRAVALNKYQAKKFADDPNVDVVTLYHGVTGENMRSIMENQNPNLIKQLRRERVLEKLDKWQNMPAKSKAFRRTKERAPNKVCCVGGKCHTEPTKCGFGINAAGGLIPGVILPEVIRELENQERPK
jgi:hypothetical protein